MLSSLVIGGASAADSGGNSLIDHVRAANSRFAARVGLERESARRVRGHESEGDLRARARVTTSFGSSHRLSALAPRHGQSCRSRANSNAGIRTFLR